MQGFEQRHIVRLRKTGEFNRVYRNGARLYGKGFTLISLQNVQSGQNAVHNEQPYPSGRSGRRFSESESRLGISVPRKVGNAVQRNRIKRIIREAFRLHRDIFPQRSDIVFAVRPGFPLTGMQAVRDAVALLTESAAGKGVR